jgi:UDP-apiose/xylose synthase
VQRIAVLGAGGFIGSHLVPALLARFGCAIDAVDIDLRKLETSDPRICRIEARIEDPALIDQLTRRAELVVSLTALCNPALYSSVPLAVIDANYTHLVPWVQRCAERGIRLIHFSTSEVYGRLALDRAGQRSLTMNEESTGLFLGPVDRERWTYACAKQLLERVIWAHGMHGTLAFTIVRLFNVIGPRMDFLPGIDGDGVPRVLASFMNALLRGQELPLVGGGHQRRTFMAVSELCEALCRIVAREEACRGQILNLGNPQNDVSILELAQKLGQIYARQVPTAAPVRLRAVTAEALYGAGYDDSEERIPDIGKALRLLEFSPAQSLDALLPAVVADYIDRYAALVLPGQPLNAPKPRGASL